MKSRLLFIISLSFSACSTLPPSIKDPPAIDISYQQANSDIAHYKGMPVRWGGVIIDVMNEQSYSLLQIMAYPLNGYGRPMPDKPHEGRFYLHSRNFLDPAIYAKDREVTAAGPLSGERELMVGKKVLKLPVLDEDTIHLWPEYERMPYYNGGYYPFSGYYGYYGYPYFWGGGFYGGYPPY